MKSSVALLALLALVAVVANADEWDPVREFMDESGLLRNVCVTVHNRSGEQFTYTHGDADENTSMRVFSASKWISGMTIMKVVEDGLLSLDDRPQQYFDWWTDDPSDPRSNMTLQHFLSFVSGFSDSGSACGARASLQECCRTGYDSATVGYVPGTTFHYLGIHLRMAGCMVEAATGVSFVDSFNSFIVEPLGLTATYYGNDINPGLDYELVSTTYEYSVILTAYWNFELLRAETIDVMEQDYTPWIETSPLGTSPIPGSHYCLGHWHECRLYRWTDECYEENWHSSPGVMGFWPLIDRQNDYFFILGTEQVPLGMFPSSFYRWQLKPLLDTALGFGDKQQQPASSFDPSMWLDPTVLEEMVKEMKY